jgi:hypothetical protein
LAGSVEGQRELRQSDLLHVGKLVSSEGFVKGILGGIQQKEAERTERRITNLRFEIPREGGLRTFVSGSNRRVRQPLSGLL